MKKIILLLFLAVVTCKSFAQIFNPVQWDFSHERVSESEVDLTFTATIDEGWYVYSQFCGEGPVATEFTFNNTDSNFSLVGGLDEGTPLNVFQNTKCHFHLKSRNVVLKWSCERMSLIQQLQILFP